MSHIPIITYQMIVELNQILEEKKIRSKVHLKDLCGSQTMWIEYLESEETVEQIEAVREIVNGYFERKNISIEYSQEGSSFWCITR